MKKSFITLVFAALCLTLPVPASTKYPTPEEQTAIIVEDLYGVFLEDLKPALRRQTRELILKHQLDIKMLGSQTFTREGIGRFDPLIQAEDDFMKKLEALLGTTHYKAFLDYRPTLNARTRLALLRDITGFTVKDKVKFEALVKAMSTVDREMKIPMTMRETAAFFEAEEQAGLMKFSELTEATNLQYLRVADAILSSVEKGGFSRALRTSTQFMKAGLK